MRPTSDGRVAGGRRRRAGEVGEDRGLSFLSASERRLDLVADLASMGCRLSPTQTDSTKLALESARLSDAREKNRADLSSDGHRRAPTVP